MSKPMTDEKKAWLTQTVYEHQLLAIELNKNMADFSYEDAGLGCDCKVCKIFEAQGLMPRIRELIALTMP